MTNPPTEKLRPCIICSLKVCHCPCELEIERLEREVKRLRAVLGKIAYTEHICRELEFRERCVFCEAEQGLSQGKENVEGEKK